MNEIVLKEKIDVEMMKKLIYSNKIDKKDQIYLINKLKKYPDVIFEVKYKNDIFGRLKTSTDNKHFIPHYMLGTINTYVWMYVCMYVRMYSCMYVYTYIYSVCMYLPKPPGEAFDCTRSRVHMLYTSVCLCVYFCKRERERERESESL